MPTAHFVPPCLDGRLGSLARVAQRLFSGVAQGEADVQNSGARWCLHIDDSCRDLVEGVCCLKEALDHVSRWPEDGEKYAWIQEQLSRVGLQPSDFTGETMVRGMGMPHGFLKVLVGSWFTYQDKETFCGVAEIPEWTVVGWVRKDQYRGTSALPQPEIVAKAQLVQLNQSTGEEVTTWGFEGVPLLWAGEGKNRTQLFRLAGMPRLSKLVLYKLPDVTELVASPMYGVPGVTVLRGGGTTEVLPFGDLSRKLLTALGVRWSDKPSVSAWFNLRTPDDELVGLRHAAQLALDRRKVRLALIGGLSFSGLKHRSCPNCV